jgi:hypothetical protein
MTNNDEKRELLDYDANLLFITGKAGRNVPYQNQELFCLHEEVKMMNEHDTEPGLNSFLGNSLPPNTRYILPLLKFRLISLRTEIRCVTGFGHLPVLVQ